MVIYEISIQDVIEELNKMAVSCKRAGHAQSVPLCSPKVRHQLYFFLCATLFGSVLNINTVKIIKNLSQNQNLVLVSSNFPIALIFQLN